jgi:ubiquinone/menaquinone biosynthesis C-methylase UbiE
MSLGFVRYAAARAPGVPFVCGDAGRLPFKDGSLCGISLSFGLHDKSSDLRALMMAEARRTLAPDGRLVAVDFETPWNVQSRAGALFAHAVERMAGGEHYRNGRDFLKRGGLRAFLRASGFVEVSRRDIATGSLGVVVARVDSNRS